MKNLIPEDDYGMFADQKGVARVDSLFVAAVFEKQHYNVLRDIERITAPASGLSPEFIALNFECNALSGCQGPQTAALPVDPRWLYHTGHGVHRSKSNALQRTLYPSLQ